MSICPKAESIGRNGTCCEQCSGLVLRSAFRLSDVVVGDADGVLVIPRETESKVLQLAQQIEEAVEGIRKAVASGMNLLEARQEIPLQRKQLQAGDNGPLTLQHDPHFVRGREAQGFVERTTGRTSMQDHRVDAISATPFNDDFHQAPG